MICQCLGGLHILDTLWLPTFASSPGRFISIGLNEKYIDPICMASRIMHHAAGVDHMAILDHTCVWA